MAKIANHSVVEKVKSVIDHIYSDLHRLEHEMSVLEQEKDIFRKSKRDQGPIGIFRLKKPVDLDKYLTKRGYEFLNGRQNT